MARRKTVREESRREVGTLDMAYSSTFVSSQRRRRRAIRGLPLRGLCSRSVCEESSEGGWEAEGRGFYSPRARRQVGLGLVLGSHACACLCLRLRTEPGEGRAPGPLELETCASRPARQDFSLAVVCLRLQGGSGGGAIGRCHMRVSVCVSFLWG